MKLIMESWRKFVNEQTAVPPVDLRQKYAASQSKLRELLDRHDNNVWVFFDTETTGLKHADPTFQVTQWGAIAIDYGPEFSNLTPIFDDTGNLLDKKLEDDAIVGTFNPMQILDPEAEEAIPIQKKDVQQLLFLLGLELDKETMTIKEKSDDFRMNDESAAKVVDIMTRYHKPKSAEMEAKKPSLINKLKRAAAQRNKKYFRNLATFMFDIGVKFNIASALDMTRYYGREEYKTRKENLIGFADYIKKVESKTGKEAFIVAHNMPYDRKALEAELDMARTDGDAAYEDAVKFLAMKFDKDTGALYDTVKLFKAALSPIVKELSKVQEYGMSTELEKQLLDNLEKVSERTGKKFYTVSLGPVTKGFAIPDEGWHDALADVIMTSKMLTAVIKFIQTGPQQVTDPIQGQLPADYKDCPKGTYPVGDQCVDVDDENLPDFLKRQKAGLTPRPERDPARQRKLPLE